MAIYHLRPNAGDDEPAYDAELAEILETIGADLAADFARIQAAEHGRLTPMHLGALAIRYRLNLHAVCQYLWSIDLLEYGAYDRLVRPNSLRAILKAGAAWLKHQDVIGRSTIDV